jgi:hypothetical protein
VTDAVYFHGAVVGQSRFSEVSLRFLKYVDHLSKPAAWAC